MPKFEKKIVEWMDKNSSILFFIIITLIGFVMRYVGKDFLSSDMSNVLIPWYHMIQDAGGLRGLKTQVGDYNVLYQTIIAFMTYIPLNPMTQYKVLSCIFDILLAYFCANHVRVLKKEPLFSTRFNCIYAVIFLLPTVVLNSAFWGQCDSIYVFTILIGIFLLHKNKNIPAFILFGVSFALKLQTVFILPYLVAYYFVKKKYSILMFPLMVLSFWSCSIIAFINGRELLAPFTAYIYQAGLYPSMVKNSRSFWLLFGEDYPRFGTFAVLLTFAILGLGFYMTLKKKKRLDTPIQCFNALAWFVWTCIFFLPAMHDRYAYLLDIILIMLAFMDKKYIKFAAFSALLSLMTYPGFLLFAGGVNRMDAFIEFFVYIYFSYLIMQPSENLPQNEAEAIAG